MRYDINNLLNLDYLNSIVSQLNNDIVELEKQLVEPYSLDNLKEINIDEIKIMFSKYDLSCVNLMQYLDSDFINQDWEYADLFADDIDYSKELEEKLYEEALLEVKKLNKAIILNNQSITNEIKNIKDDIWSLEKIATMLDSHYFVLEEDITWLMDFVSKQGFDMAVYRFSSEISKLLIAKNKEILEKKASEDEQDFESSLEAVYDEPEENLESIYLEKINMYFEKYHGIFQHINIGKTLDEVMTFANELAVGVENIKSLDDFCIILGDLFYKICNTKDGFECEQLMAEVLELDNLYEKRKKKVDILVDEILGFKNRLSKDTLDDAFYVSLCDTADKYKKQVISNMFDDTVYDRVKELLGELNNTFGQVMRLTEINNTIKKLLNDASSFLNELTNHDYIELSELQTEVLYYMDFVMQNGYSKEVESIYSDYLSRLEKYNTKEDDNKVEKIGLKGFVLFDFGEDNIPYVVTDLDPRSKDNLIDGSIQQGKCDSGFQDFSDLVSDILLCGGLKAMTDETNNNYSYKLLTPVYLDKMSRKNPSGMMRVRPSKGSLVRFISRDAVLKKDTEIFNQVANLLEEILPGVKVNRSCDFKLVVNFASSMKASSDESYHVCINRYNRRSPLFRLFFSDTSKTRLSDSELDLLRDIIHMSMDSYSKLEKANPKIHFDIIKQIGGKNTYGK